MEAVWLFSSVYIIPADSTSLSARTALWWASASSKSRLLKWQSAAHYLANVRKAETRRHIRTDISDVCTNDIRTDISVSGTETRSLAQPAQNAAAGLTSEPASPLL